jgi:hypothetical protein
MQGAPQTLDAVECCGDACKVTLQGQLDLRGGLVALRLTYL